MYQIHDKLEVPETTYKASKTNCISNLTGTVVKYMPIITFTYFLHRETMDPTDSEGTVLLFKPYISQRNSKV